MVVYFSVFVICNRDRKVHKEGRLSYADFVWFLISEEDKKTETRYEPVNCLFIFILSMHFHVTADFFH